MECSIIEMLNESNVIIIILHKELQKNLLPYMVEGPEVSIISLV